MTTLGYTDGSFFDALFRSLLSAVKRFSSVSLSWRFLGSSFAIGFGRLDQRADLLVHVKLHIVISAAVLAARAGAFPAAEGLEAGPGAGRRALRTVGIGHACFDVFEEPIDFLGGAIETRSETIVHVVGDLHRLIQISDLANRCDGQEHFILPQAMLIGQVGDKGRFAEVALIEDAACLHMPTGEEVAASLVDLFGEVLEIVVGALVDDRTPDRWRVRSGRQ